MSLVLLRSRHRVSIAPRQNVPRGLAAHLKYRRKARRPSRRLPSLKGNKSQRSRRSSLNDLGGNRCVGIARGHFGASCVSSMSGFEVIRVLGFVLSAPGIAVAIAQCGQYLKEKIQKLRDASKIINDFLVFAEDLHNGKLKANTSSCAKVSLVAHSGIPSPRPSSRIVSLLVGSTSRRAVHNTYFGVLVRKQESLGI